MSLKILSLSSRLMIATFLLSAAAWGQTAQITGRVTDSSGAVAPGASISARNVATGIDRTVESNELGYYTIPLLPPGEYRVSVDRSGFRPMVRSGIILVVDQRAELDFALEVGTVSEQIEVRAAIQQLNTAESSQGQVIENRRIVELPLNGRNYGDLALLSAGTVQPLDNARFAGFSSGGMRDTQNNYILDGIDNNPTELAGAQRRSEMVQPSVDGIQEFKVQTNAYSAEYGRAMGATINVTTKSGTNDVHGTAFEFLRNEKLDAKNFFDDPTKPKPAFKRNQYGFSLGGPMFIPKVYDGRNRFFFFVDYEGTKIRQSSTIVSTLPTALMRTGNFSELLTARNLTLLDPTTGAAFAGNVIPTSRLDSVAKNLIGLYPTPMTSGVASNYTYASPAIQDVNKVDGRLDYNLGASDNIAFRYSRQAATIPATPNLPAPAYGGNPYDSAVRGINTGATWNHIFGPNLVLSVRGGWNYGYFSRDNPVAANGELLNQKYGINSGANNTIPGGFSQMSITGYQGLGLGPNNPVYRDSQNRQVAGDLNWTHGAHTFKMGGSIIRSQNNIFNIRNEIGGPYTFDGRYTKDGMADFLLGLTSGFTWSTRLQVNLRSWYEAAFIQDDWKINNKLTLNLGVRYEIVLPFLDTRDRMGTFDDWTDPANPKLIFAGSQGSDRYNRAMFGTDKNNFMPRIGFAYKATPKTVVRAGVGMFYGYLEPYGDAEYLIGNPPNAFGVTLSGSTTTPALLLSQGLPSGALTLAKATGVTFTAYERKANMGYSEQWNFNVQREVGRDWMFEVGYSGSHGVHLLNRYDDNFSAPGAGNVNAKRPYQSVAIPGTSIVTSPLGPVYGYHNNGNSIYHALSTKIEKRFSAGLTLLGSYTYSKAIGDTCGNSAAGDTAGCGYQDIRNIRVERSVDNIDVPHRFVSSGMYELPFGRGRHFGAKMPTVVNAVLGGWSMGSIITMASGRPYNVISQGNPANTGSFGVVNRPNVNGDPYSIDRSVGRDFDTSVFTNNAAYVVGNAGRNILRQRSFFNWDYSALKEFKPLERLTAQFRFEAFHFTNTPRFGSAGNTLGTSTFGKITSADTPRNLQMGLKLLW